MKNKTSFSFVGVYESRSSKIIKMIIMFEKKLKKESKIKLRKKSRNS